MTGQQQQSYKLSTYQKVQSLPANQFKETLKHTCAQPGAKDKEMLPSEEAKYEVLLSSTGKQQHLGAAPHQLGTPGCGLLGICKDPICEHRSSSSHHKERKLKQELAKKIFSPSQK